MIFKFWTVNERESIREEYEKWIEVRDGICPYCSLCHKISFEEGGPRRKTLENLHIFEVSS